MIKRADHGKNFTIFSNDPLRDYRLSFAARGLLLFMLSHPDDWVFNKKYLENASPAGRYGVKKLLKELEDFDYIKSKAVRQSGKFSFIEYILYEKPETAPEGALTVDHFTAVDSTADGVTVDGETAPTKYCNIRSTDSIRSTELNNNPPNPPGAVDENESQPSKEDPPIEIPLAGKNDMPTEQEVCDFIIESGMHYLDGKSFYHELLSRGWRDLKNEKVRNWKALARSWNLANLRNGGFPSKLYFKSEIQEMEHGMNDPTHEDEMDPDNFDKRCFDKRTIQKTRK